MSSSFSIENELVLAKTSENELILAKTNENELILAKTSENELVLARTSSFSIENELVFDPTDAKPNHPKIESYEY